MIRIGIAGLAGRMGRLLAEEVRESSAILVGGIDRHPLPADGEAKQFPDIAALASACDVVVDFTHASTIPAHAAALAEAGTAWVLGTTGLTAGDEALVAGARHRIPIVQAANFSPGVNLMFELAERLGAALPGDDYDAEILEIHHRQKVDAPSGTAIALGRAVASGRGIDLADMTESGRHGQTGARKPGAIGFAALRAGQIVGEHTLLFTSASEQISLTHRAFDRRAFARGALRAALWVPHRPPGLYSMAHVLAMK